jgi:carbamoyltransferase
VPQRDEYMMAQLAANGNYKRFSKIMLNEIITPPYRTAKISMKENLHRGCSWWRPELTSEQDIADIAAATQRIFELSLKHLSKWAKNETVSTNLALAGGGALNRQAVDLIRRKWKNVHVPHNPGDPGSCVGAVLAQTKTKIDLEGKWMNGL